MVQVAYCGTARNLKYEPSREKVKKYNCEQKTTAVDAENNLSSWTNLTATSVQKSSLYQNNETIVLPVLFDTKSLIETQSNV